MGEELVLEESEFGGIPDEDDILVMEIMDVARREMPFKDEVTDKPVEKMEFTFVVREEGPFKNLRLWGSTPTTFTTHVDCKLRAWVLEILGESDLPKGFKLDTDELKGLKVRGVVGHREDKKNNVTRAYVRDVMRLPLAQAL